MGLNFSVLVSAIRASGGGGTPVTLPQVAPPTINVLNAAPSSAIVAVAIGSADAVSVERSSTANFTNAAQVVLVDGEYTETSTTTPIESFKLRARTTKAGHRPSNWVYLDVDILPQEALQTPTLAVNVLGQSSISITNITPDGNAGSYQFYAVTGQSETLLYSGANATFTHTALTPATTYNYRVVAIPANIDFVQSSATGSATTAQLNKLAAVSNLAQSNYLAGTPATQSLLSFNAVANADTYEIRQNAALVATIAGTSHVLTGLANGTAYTITVIAVDAQAAYLNSDPATLLFTKNYVQDKLATPISLVINDYVAGTPATQSQLTFNAVANAESYEIRQNGVLAATIAGTSHVLTGLANGTAYTITVIAVDAQGVFLNSDPATLLFTKNYVAAKLATVTALTQQDNTAGTPATETLITFNAVVNAEEYEIRQNGVLVATIAETSIVLIDLVDAETYIVQVIAVDSASVYLNSNPASITFKKQYVENAVVYDAIFTEFGANPFYERADNLTIVGTTLTRADGGEFTDEHIGKQINIKNADNVRYTPRVVSWYGTIASITSTTEAELTAAPPLDVEDEMGYFFFDNTLAFRAACAAANTSANSRFKIKVPQGTYVILEPNDLNTPNGGFAFIAETFANFKIFKEEQDFFNQQKGFVKWGAFSNMGNHTYEFLNINFVGADNYSYFLENNHSIIRTPQSGTSTVAPTIKIINCDETYEKVTLNDSIEAYLTRKGYSGAALTEAKKLLFSFALPERVKTKSLGILSGATIVQYAYVYLTNITPVETQNYCVTLSNILSTAGLIYEIDGYQNFKGVHTTGRLGLLDSLTTKAKIDVLADADGDFTVLRINPNSPLKYRFNELHNQYDQFQYKRADVNVFFKLGFAGRLNQKLFVGVTKKIGASGAIMGVVAGVQQQAAGVYEVLITPNVAYSDAISGRFKNAGVGQYDDIIGNNNGALVAGFANGTNSLVELGTGKARDYRAWCVYKYGDNAWHGSDIGLTGRTEEYYTNTALSNEWAGQIIAYVGAETMLANVGDTVTYTDISGVSRTAYLKAIETAQFGFKLTLWKTVSDAKISYTYGVKNGTNLLVGAQVIGTSLFVVRAQIGNRASYPNGAPFTVGETLYTFALGSGDSAYTTFDPCRYAGDVLYLPKHFALTQAYTNQTLDYCYYARSTETHFMYTSDGFQGLIKDWSAEAGANYSQFIRKQGSAQGYDLSAGYRRFVNVFNQGHNIEAQYQDQQIVEIDGGEIYFSSIDNPIHTTNAPKIYATTITSVITPQDGTGYYLNNVFVATP